MRAITALSLLHDPEIVYLDEPTIGLDAVGKDQIRQFILSRNREFGTTFVVTSHDMVDIAQLCSRVLIIDRGMIIYDGSINDIVARYSRERVLTVDFSRSYENVVPLFGSIVADKGPIKSIRFRRDDGTAVQLINDLVTRYEIVDVSIVETDIEQIIRSIYERGI